jgi:hypothetical protein
MKLVKNISDFLTRIAMAPSPPTERFSPFYLHYYQPTVGAEVYGFPVDYAMTYAQMVTAAGFTGYATNIHPDVYQVARFEDEIEAQVLHMGHDSRSVLDVLDVTKQLCFRVATTFELLAFRRHYSEFGCSLVAIDERDLQIPYGGSYHAVIPADLGRTTYSIYSTRMFPEGFRKEVGVLVVKK